MAAQIKRTVIQLRRGSTADWLLNKDVVPAAGEPCYDLDLKTLRIGDGVTTYENLNAIGATELSSAVTHYEGVRTNSESDIDVIGRILAEAGAEANKDDIFVVKALIADDHYSHTAYVYNGKSWLAMDGNYSANNIYFNSNIFVTDTTGYIVLDDEQGCILTEGKNLSEALEYIVSILNGDETVAGSVANKITSEIDLLDLEGTYAPKSHEHDIADVAGLSSIVAEYAIVKAEDSGDYAAIYNLTKNGATIGTPINIPKDIVVKSGSVVGDEIILVLNNNEATEIKIPVTSLVEYVTSGSQAGDMVVITVDETTHKVTATITDGTITAAKLTTELQTTIGKAHSHENADVLAGINADKVAAWDAAEQNAKDYADSSSSGVVAIFDPKIADLEGKAHEHANKALLDTYAQTEENLADAVAKKHAHANATVLDGIEEADITAWDAKVDSVVAATDSGLKATREGNAITLDFDDSITFIFDCGDSGVTE